MSMNSSSKLFVGCLPFSKTEVDVSALFGQFGQLTEVALLKHGDGSSKGAAFVTFASDKSAWNASMQLQGYLFEGSTRGINVSVANSGGPSASLHGKGMYVLPPGGGGMGSDGSNSKGYVLPPGGGGMVLDGSNSKGWLPQPSSQKGVPSKGNWQQLQPSPQNHSQQLQSSSQKDIPGTKCFVGKLPFSRSESEVMQLFSSCGPVVEVVLLTDKHTGEKKGAAIVRFATPQHAAAAVNALNGFCFHGSTRPISVDIAQGNIATTLGTVVAGPGKRTTYGAVAPGCKLFVGKLPFSKSEGAIKEVFQSYGSVVEVSLHRNAHGEKTGGAFVNFSDPESASAALQMDGYMFPGATRPCTVSLAAKRQRIE